VHKNEKWNTITTTVISSSTISVNQTSLTSAANVGWFHDFIHYRTAAYHDDPFILEAVLVTDDRGPPSQRTQDNTASLLLWASCCSGGLPPVKRHNGVSANSVNGTVTGQTDRQTDGRDVTCKWNPIRGLLKSASRPTQVKLSLKQSQRVGWSNQEPVLSQLWRRKWN